LLPERQALSLLYKWYWYKEDVLPKYLISILEDQIHIGISFRMCLTISLLFLQNFKSIFSIRFDLADVGKGF
jgi:hypothetical protein